MLQYESYSTVSTGIRVDEAGSQGWGAGQWSRPEGGDVLSVSRFTNERATHARA